MTQQEFSEKLNRFPEIMKSFRNVIKASEELNVAIRNEHNPVVGEIVKAYLRKQREAQ